MKLLPRYLITRLCATTFYALIALLALYSFFDIVAEAGDIGEGKYNGSMMLQYVAMQIPAHAYELMPLAVLIGALIALNLLASGSELTVMKASGMSTARLMGILIQYGLIFAVATTLLGEWVAPAASQYAENMKATAIDGRISAGKEGIWLKEGQTIINVREMLPDQSLLGIKAWQHNDQYRLVETLAAESAQINEQGWTLHHVNRTLLGETQVNTVHEQELKWPLHISTKLFSVLMIEPEQMSLSALSAYIDHLKSNHQQTKAYEIAWWRKLMYPIAAVVMALVALAFTPQSTRQGNMGLKLFFGICLGLGFHFIGRLFGFTSQLYGVPPIVAALLPTILFASWGAYLIYHQEKR